MPGLIGYMLAIVITLGGYLAGLHWLVSPPDPWQPNPKTTQIAKQTARKRLPPVVTPAEASPPEAATPMEPDSRLASAETPTVSASVQSEPATARLTEPIRVEATRPAAELTHVVHRDVQPARARPSLRKRVERKTSRKLELMVLRTYERSDGKRFTRLLPLNSARHALAFQPDDGW